ncbi:cysteine--1-D-myo-inosityl 2-amino-2-deoxy-alpha-D-glucopyranoside ligase [Natronoglycomyces albus]|uniref:L-cysteine:1D-myo-inositol 2-amino-2-deoxy-alpha-D-glucopyranoside ligase n=1 Tax=Natronoglycomyces albus TaxID=2811108 RepID=A0A895XNL3_9ACTN|nr:cysteine--1-D-myo-inosityl 2-amino-2-deoxy-alpha-D-glucopyranoside ligase [Natronoglycomyces albus]QSB06717.1 cysteine--1-D-myo-inosityl 2-amino-2-deoxy-alpha-D-glucopyranoside ligase [Natronoglycomyces albus]
MESWQKPELATLPGHGKPLRLFDTSSQETRNPLEPGQHTATLYVCGITPYDATHLGHAATMLTFDLVNRYWRDAGIEVRYVQNVTDVDEPLFERAKRDQDDWRILGMRETALYREDMEALAIVPPESFVGAIETIPEVAQAVAQLLESGHAYRHPDEDGDIYFDVTSHKEFGYQSGYDRSTMLKYAAERGGDPDRPGKRDPLDPKLWNGPRGDEPSWDTPVGPGRPGWHIECTVIARKYLKDCIDVQGGGNDLIFPHHECSIAHAEALSGTHPFASVYSHTGMIGLEGEKMSKSLGNLVFVSRLRADGINPDAIRIALFDGHYRSDRQWTQQSLARAEERLRKWSAACEAPAGAEGLVLVNEVRDHIANDLDTPAALAAIDAWAARTLGGETVDADAPGLARTMLSSLFGVTC